MKVFLTAAAVVVALVAGNVATVLALSQAPDVTIGGQIASYAALLLADLAALWLIGAAVKETQH